eukprot:353684-Chlamydomonas_euryale.AAC.9
MTSTKPHLHTAFQLDKMLAGDELAGRAGGGGTTTWMPGHAASRAPKTGLPSPPPLTGTLSSPR